MGSYTCRTFVSFGVSVRFSFCMCRLLVTLPTSSMRMFDARIWLANCCQPMGSFDGLESPFPQLDALEMKTLTKPSLPTRLNYSAIPAMGRWSPTLIGIVMSSTAPRLVHQRSSTTNGFDNWMSSPKTEPS